MLEDLMQIWSMNVLELIQRYGFSDFPFARCVLKSARAGIVSSPMSCHIDSQLCSGRF